MFAKLSLALASILFLSLFLPTPEETTLERGRRHTQQFYDGEHETLWKELSPELRKLFGGIPALEEFRAQVEAQLGAEAEVLDEQVESLEGGETYVRKARFEKFAGVVSVHWSFDRSGTVVGFQVVPERSAKGDGEAPSPYLDYETKTRLQLPFAAGDEWTVFWGGRTVQENYHAAYVDQRFAYDLVAVVDGSTHRGEGKRNEDYYCFGRGIVAPGAGTVVSARGDLADNVPGVMDPAHALGNHVILDHGNGEYSFLAHFRQGSLLVKVGETVEAGQPLARAGNSGNTSEPHLHYHLQDAPEFQQGGKGLPAQFQHYLSNGRLVERGEPVKGERIRVAETRDDLESSGE